MHVEARPCHQQLVRNLAARGVYRQQVTLLQGVLVSIQVGSADKFTNFVAIAETQTGKRKDVSQ